MIEREFIKTKIKHLQIRNRIEEIISKGAGIGKVNIEKTPLGERITIYAVRPGLIIGRGGETIKQLTQELKIKYALENPQIEVKEITIPELDATVVAKQIAVELENFGIKRFKSVGYRLLDKIIRAGAMGAEIRMAGKIPGKRAKTWRFYKGYLKKSGDIAMNYVDTSIQVARTLPGIVGIKVSIMHKDTPLPDNIELRAVASEIKVEELSGKEVDKTQQEINEIVKAQQVTEKPVAAIKEKIPVTMKAEVKTEEHRVEEKAAKEEENTRFPAKTGNGPKSEALRETEAKKEEKKEPKHKLTKKKKVKKE